MFGETYFASREGIIRLASEVFDFATAIGISDDSAGQNATENHALTKTCITQTLQRPFVLLACGEVNSGKSSILNAIIGHDICHVHDLPQTDHVHHFFYSSQPQAIIEVDDIRRCASAAPQLRFVELIEAIGTDATKKMDHSSMKQMIAMADAVLVLFPVSNPWGAPTWDFMNRYSAELQYKAVIVLQQCDKKTAADLPVLLGHLRDLSMKRLGHTPVLFPIAAKLANDARHANRNDILHLKNTGIPALQKQLEQKLLSSPARRSALKMVRLALSEKLRRIEDLLEHRSRQLLLDGYLLTDIENEIDHMRVETLRNQSNSLGGVGVMFQKEAANAAIVLKKRLSLPIYMLRLFTGEDTAYAVEALILPQLLKALSDVTGHDFQSLVFSCCNHWLLLGNKIKKSMSTEVQSLEITRSRLDKSAEDFLDRMAQSSARATNQLRLRGTLDAALRQHHHSMRVILGTCLIFTTIAGVCGGMYWNWPAMISLVLASIFFLILIGVMLRNRNQIVQEFGFQLSSQRDSFVESMRGDYEEGMRLFYKDYNNCLDSVRAHLVVKKHESQRQIKRWNDLFLALKALEQEFN